MGNLKLHMCVQVCIIFLFLGGNRLIKDIEMMLGKKSFIFWLWWRACWFILSPCIIVVSATTLDVPETKETHAGLIITQNLT